jgi:BTB/POZ domain
MATLTVLPSALSTPRVPSRNGIKRRCRSPSPESETPERDVLKSEEWEVGSRPRKTRKLGERPPAALIIPALPHVLQEPPPFNIAAEKENVDNQGPASISPAAFAEAMDGVLCTTSDTPNLPTMTISPPFISQSIPAPSLNPSTQNFTFVSNDWWFPTGDLVLGVENLMFRVHKRVLAQHSVVFEDMFALSEPSSDCEVVENAPFVQLHDAAADWIETFSWLYTGRFANSLSKGVSQTA